MRETDAHGQLTRTEIRQLVAMGRDRGRRQLARIRQSTHPHVAAAQQRWQDTEDTQAPAGD